MTKRNLTKPTALLLAATLVTSCFVGGTFARYITSTTSEDSARVAVWGINADDVEMELFASEYDVNGNKVAKSWDGAKIIAPGTSMASKFSIVNLDDTLAPEVMYEVRIDVDDTEIDQRILDNPSIQWKLDNNSWGTWESTKADILALSGDASGVKTYAPNEIATEFANGKEHTIAWQWMLDDNNVQDTAMGNDAVDEDILAKIVVNVTARQVQEDTTGLLNGEGQTFYLNNPQPLTFRSAAPVDELVEVKVGDDVLTEDTDYTVTSGSTVVTLKEDYLKTLKVGSYKLSIVSENGTVATTFKVTSPLDSNEIVIMGTSITNVQSISSPPIGYINIISDKNNVNLTNYAVGGHNIKQLYASQYNTNFAKTKLSSLTENDYFILEGLLNSVVLDFGSITPNETTTFDLNTVAGTLEEIISDYKEKGYKAKIGMIFTTMSTTMIGNDELTTKYNNLWDLGISICEKYNVPYLDLRDKEYTKLDNVHPNLDGHKTMAVDVENWLNTL